MGYLKKEFLVESSSYVAVFWTTVQALYVSVCTVELDVSFNINKITKVSCDESSQHSSLWNYIESRDSFFMIKAPIAFKQWL